MRKNIVAGNWKMNKTVQEGVQLAGEIKELLSKNAPKNVTVIIAPPFVHLTEVKKVIGNSIELSAQNVASEEKGAFTGEVSADMVKSTGASYVIIGHSERRAYYNETDQILYKKVLLAQASGLTPIFCIGEVLAEREANKHFDVVKKQLTDGLFGLSKEAFAKVVIAYEPVWAIGTGKTATSAQAQEIHKYIRGVITEKYGKEVADSISILYGGSCNAANAKELFANPDVDGGLIGGAALKSQDFYTIIASL
jgi:triosephosphate isomerase (TIM)